MCDGPIGSHPHHPRSRPDRWGGDWTAQESWRHHVLPKIPTFEMHHAVDLPEEASEHAPPFALEGLMEATTAADFNVGGWFLFAKSDRWALRSNEFTSAPYAQTRARLDAQSAALRQCVRRLMPQGGHRPVISRASLERVHAIWQVG